MSSALLKRVRVFDSRRGHVRLGKPGSLASNVIVCYVSEKLRLTIAYEDPDEEGWIVARVVEVPGAMSQGRTREEARRNVVDALRVMLSPDEGEDGGKDRQVEPLELVLAE